jgi:hypothetical protein
LVAQAQGDIATAKEVPEGALAPLWVMFKLMTFPGPGVNSPFNDVMDHRTVAVPPVGRKPPR